jgi:hypothetical protein
MKWDNYDQRAKYFELRQFSEHELEEVANDELQPNEIRCHTLFVLNKFELGNDLLDKINENLVEITLEDSVFLDEGRFLSMPTKSLESYQKAYSLACEIVSEYPYALYARNYIANYFLYIERSGFSFKQPQRIIQMTKEKTLEILEIYPNHGASICRMAELQLFAIKPKDAKYWVEKMRLESVRSGVLKHKLPGWSWTQRLLSILCFMQKNRLWIAIAIGLMTIFSYHVVLYISLMFGFVFLVLQTRKMRTFLYRSFYFRRFSITVFIIFGFLWLMLSILYRLISFS